MIFKFKYGMIKENYLLLYKLNSGIINISTITEINICKREPSRLIFANYFKNKLYDFTIILDNKEEITFSFSKNYLPKAIAFKTRIWHTKFSLGDSIPKNHMII